MGINNNWKFLASTITILRWHFSPLFSNSNSASIYSWLLSPTSHYYPFFYSILIYSKQPSCQWLHLLLSSSKPVMLFPTISKSVIVLKYVLTSTSKGGHFVEIFPGHYICFWGVTNLFSLYFTSVMLLSDWLVKI